MTIPSAQMHPTASPYSGGTQAYFTTLSSCILDLEVQMKDEDARSIELKMVSVTSFEPIANLSSL